MQLASKILYLAGFVNVASRFLHYWAFLDQDHKYPRVYIKQTNL